MTKPWYFAHANGESGCGHEHRTRKGARRCLPRVTGDSRPFIVKQWRDAAGNLYELPDTRKRDVEG